MPVMRGQDEEGTYYRWGKTGKKYYYRPGDENSRRRAKLRAQQQGIAARASGYEEGS